MTATNPGTQGDGSSQQAPPAPSPQFDGNGTLTWNGQEYVPMERYSGLRGKVQEQSNALTEWKAKYTEISTEAEGGKAELQTQLQSLTAQRDQLQTSLQEFTTKQTEFQILNQSLQAKLEATNMVITEFPELATEYSQGFYATDGKAGDDLRNFLKGIQSTRQNLMQQGAANFNAGSTPPPPPGGGQSAPNTAQQLQEKLDSIRPGTTEWQTTYNEWVAAATAQK